MRLVSRTVIAAAASLSLLAGGAAVAQAVLTQNPAEVRAGTYKLDPAHGKVTWSVDHMGFSTYVGQFVNARAELTLDPANPSASRLTATIPLTEVDTNSDGLDAHLQTADFFDTANHPVATFVSRSVTVDAEDSSEAVVVGDLTLRGVTRPVTMAVEFNQAGDSMGAYKAGFDGEATIRRSDFGINYGVPVLGDDVTLHIEGEFIRQ